MDLSNLPPNHGGPLGDVWFRGLAKPDHFISAMKDDFWILVAGCMMKYIRLEKADNGLTYKARVVKAFSHGVDGVSSICGSQFKDVYALAEKRARPRIFIFQIMKTDKGELEPNYMHSLKRVKSWDIRSMQFISKELFVVLTGFPTFNVVLFKWSTNEELMTSLATPPNLFSKLVINPINPCQWVEYGQEHLYVYEMPSFSRTDVIRTAINLPKRTIKFDRTDPFMGKQFATKIVSACWTISGEFFILDDQCGIHQYISEEKIVRWMCTLTQTFLGEEVTQIVPYADGIAAITMEGWFLYYGEIKLGGQLEVQTAYKLSSNVVRYVFFPENPDSFFAITDSKGMIEGVSLGLLRDPFAIPDLLFDHIMSCCFIEPQSDYMAIVTKFGKIVILECETGEPIAKWKLPFKVVGVSHHPILPFLFCGTTYGCVNVLDVRNLKTPKLINRRFLTREPNPAITRFGFISQGRYVVSADTVNNRIFVQYGYPFMSFDFIDTAKLPARISYISVPGCGKDDNRFQVYMNGKSPADEGVVAFVINFSLRNDRLMVVASQTVDQPVTTICMSPMKKYLYAFYPTKKGLGVVPFCDDNQWLSLQDPEHLVENRLKADVNFMFFQGAKLYTFSEDGIIQVHEAPVIPKKKTQLPMVLSTLSRTQTHCFSDRGIKEGVVSLDGSQVIALGYDGTFSRVRFFAKPKEPDWQILGYDRPKLIDYQVGTYLIDQEFYKAGEEFMDRIADIKVKIDQEDPVSFYAPGEETSDEEEEIVPTTDTPKAETVGEKFKYGPRKSFKGTITRKKIQKQEAKAEGQQPDEITQKSDSSNSDKVSRGKKRVTITTEGSTKAEEASVKEGSDENKSIKSDMTQLTTKSEAPSTSTAAPAGDTTDGEASISTTAPITTTEGGVTSQEKPAAVSVEGKPVEETTKEPKTEAIATEPTAGKLVEEPVPPLSAPVPPTRPHTDSQATAPKETSGSDDSKSPEFTTDKDDTLMEDITVASDGKDKTQAAAGEVTTKTLMEPKPTMEQAKSTTEAASTPTPKSSQAFKQRRGSKQSTRSRMSSKSRKKQLKTGESTVVQKLLSKVQDTAIAPLPKPLSLAQMKQERVKMADQQTEEKTATTAAIKTAATTTSTALKGILSERTKRKQKMAKDKAGKTTDTKAEEEALAAEQKKAEETVVTEESTAQETTETAAEEGATGEETTAGETSAEEGSKPKGLFKKGLKGIGDMKKAAKVLSLMFGKKGKKKGKLDKDKSKDGVKKKIKKFQGGQASKMLAAQSEASSTTKVKAPVVSRTGRNRLGQAKLMKQIIDDENLDPLAEAKSATKAKKKAKSPKGGKKGAPEPKAMPVTMAPKGRKKEDVSEASRALMMESETSKNLEMSVLNDPAIHLQPDKPAKPYEGLDVDDVLTVHHAIRYKEYTEPEFFTQFEKTLLHRWHVPKAQALRREFARFTELMDDLMFFNKQREEGNQVELKEFNFDDDREPRLKERAEKMKKIANIQMVVRNKLRNAKINAMKHLVWEQFDCKGMTLMGFRKKLEVSNYPLLQESEFYDGPVNEAISWRRLEQRLELEEADALREANGHALRVLQHEMQFMPPIRKRQYMKSIMAIDPNIRFDEYEASDSEQSDEEFFTKVFEELGIQLPEDGIEKDDGKGAKSDAPRSKAAGIMGIMQATSKAASKFMQKRKEAIASREQQAAAQPESYVEKLKQMLLEEAADEPAPEPLRPITADSSFGQSEAQTRIQSRRDFMMNIKPSRDYYHPKGVFGPTSTVSVQGEGRRDEIEVLMEPHRATMTESRGKTALEMGLTGPENMMGPDAAKPDAKPTKMRMVIRQRKKMKFKRVPDVVFEDEEDLSGPEDEAVVVAQQRKFDAMDDEYKERFETINSIFYGSSLSELVDMYQFRPAPFRYSQFDLGSRHELWRHHYIIMSEIYQLKKFFNRQFDMLRNAKAYNLRKMADRNERIREIYYYLKVDLDILDEKWRILEDPSQIFTVTKEEIPIEKYLTAEQRRLEELRRLEDLARRKTRMAEFRKKALYTMMDNRLEVKREEILVNDIPKPSFMLEKDPLEFTLEEYLQSLQYAEAVEALEKARVDLIKELEEELGRLYRANAMDINTIDLRVYEIALMKFQFHQNFQMEETRILRAIRQLRMMEELDKEERKIGKIVVELKASMKGAQTMAAQLENKKIACEEEIAKVAEQEKDLERNFRRDLGDVGLYFEFFYKNYKKKPKLSLKGLNKLDVYDTMVRALRSDNIRNFAKENGETGRIVVMAIYDLEDPMLMPKDCPRSYWDKFNRVRRERLVCEYQTKTLVSEIDRITEAINECDRKEAEGTAAIAAVLGVISHKNDLKTYFVANVEFQMVLGKGQCEIDCWSFEDHINATIILIENVEKLNHKIFEASEKLIKEMTKTASVHRDIKEIEWRFLVVEMATKDLKKVRHDVGCFKPTKKLLEVLRKGINLDTMHTDRIALVDYLKTTYIKYQRIFLRTKRKLLRFYQRQTHHRHDTNELYRGNIFEQTENLVASQVNKISPDFNAHKRDEIFEKRTMQLMLRGFLNRKIIKLCNEVERLEEELERQYQRTYPVL